MTVQERLDVLDAADLIHWPKKGTMPAYKRYLSAALRAPIQDIVWDIAPIGSAANERMGYATQKPVALLERIIDASSNEGDMVLDPFCGCATTIEAAHRLDRRWIGIDIAIQAIKRVAQIRLSERLHLKAGENCLVEGIPRNLEGAQDLWQRDKYHFQEWAVEQVDDFVTSRQTGDGGVDGRLDRDAPARSGKGTKLHAVYGRGRRLGNTRDALPAYAAIDSRGNPGGRAVLHAYGRRQAGIAAELTRRLE